MQSPSCRYKRKGRTRLTFSLPQYRCIKGVNSSAGNKNVGQRLTVDSPQQIQVKKKCGQQLTDHSPQQTLMKFKFAFHLGINFDKALQIAVDSQLWTVDKKKPSAINGQKKSPRSSEIYIIGVRIRLSQFFFLLLLPLLRFRLLHRQEFFRSAHKRSIFSFHGYPPDAVGGPC